MRSDSAAVVGLAEEAAGRKVVEFDLEFLQVFARLGKSQFLIRCTRSHRDKPRAAKIEVMLGCWSPIVKSCLSSRKQNWMFKVQIANRQLPELCQICRNSVASNTWECKSRSRD